MPPPQSRAALRGLLADQAHQAGIGETSIEISATEPFEAVESTEDVLESEPTALLSTTAVVSGTAKFDQLVRFVHLLSNPRPLILVRQASFEREDATDGDVGPDSLKFSLRLAFVESPADEPASTPSVSPIPEDER